VRFEKPNAAIGGPSSGSAAGGCHCARRDLDRWRGARGIHGRRSRNASAEGDAAGDAEFHIARATSVSGARARFPGRSRQRPFDRGCIMSYTELTVWTRGINMDKEGATSSFDRRLRPPRGEVRAGDGNYVDQPRSHERADAQVLPHQRQRDRKRVTYENDGAEHPRARRGDDGGRGGTTCAGCRPAAPGDQHALPPSNSAPCPDRSGWRSWSAWTPRSWQTTSGSTYRLGERPRSPPSEGAGTQQGVAPDIARIGGVQTTGIAKWRRSNDDRPTRPAFTPRSISYTSCR